MIKYFTPFEKISKLHKTIILISWLVLLIVIWFATTAGEKHLFPSPSQVLKGFKHGLLIGCRQVLHKNVIPSHPGATMKITHLTALVLMSLSLSSQAVRAAEGQDVAAILDLAGRVGLRDHRVQLGVELGCAAGA